MGVKVDLTVAELLCSRLCHDLVSPLNTVNAGLEMLADGAGVSLVEAAGLANRSAIVLTQKITFFRTAFGLAGGAGVTADLADVEALCHGYLAGGKVELNWQVAAPLAVPRDHARLLMNLIVLGAECLPRGGQVSVAAAALPEGFGMAVAGSGAGARLRDEVRVALDPAAAPTSLDVRTVQPHFAALVARGLNGVIEINTDDADRVELACIATAVNTAGPQR